AQAALDLLGQRAAEESRPWPEFAEMDCFACHHDLKAKSWRLERGYKGKAGAVPYRPWYVTMLERSLEMVDKAEAKTVHGELATLLKLMEKTVPDRLAVSLQAKRISGRLDASLGKINEPLDLDALYRRIRTEDVPRAKDN